MKKLFIILFILVGCLAFSQTEIFYNSTPTLQWDAVIEDGNGDPILPEDTISYAVYLWDTAGGDITLQTLSALTFFGQTTSTELLLNFPYRANWACGIMATLTDGEGNIISSDLSYTVDNPPVTATGPFVYVPLSGTLPEPMGLRDSGI